LLAQVQHCKPSNKFWDDCGAWLGSTGRKVFLDINTGNEVRQLPNGRYGMRKRSEGVRRLVELERQPEAVAEVHQLDSRLKRATTFQRRITYVTGGDCFIAEYIGQFPAEVTAHGNAVYNTAEYVRSKPEVLADMKCQLKSTGVRPQKLYQNMKDNADSDLQCPRNKKQVTC